MDKTTRKRIMVGIVGLLLIGCILLCLKLLYPNERYQPWELPVEHLEWNMSIDEVEKYYELTKEETGENKHTLNFTIQDEQSIYGQKMRVTLTFSPVADLGLTRITGVSSEMDLEKLVGTIEKMYGESGDYWDTTDQEAKKSYYWASKKVQEEYTREEVEKAYQEHWDVQQGTASAFNSVVASTMMKDLSYIMLAKDENESPVFIMDALYRLLLEDTKASSSGSD